MGMTTLLSPSSEIQATEQHISNSVNFSSCKEGTIIHSRNVLSTDIDVAVGHASKAVKDFFHSSSILMIKSLGTWRLLGQVPRLFITLTHLFACPCMVLLISYSLLSSYYFA